MRACAPRADTKLLSTGGLPLAAKLTSWRFFVFQEHEEHFHFIPRSRPIPNSASWMVMMITGL